MSRRAVGIAVALLFLASTVTFVLGSSLITAAFAPGGTTPQLAGGVALETFTALAVLAIALLVRPVLAERTPGLATAYLGLRAAECAAILGVGSWFLVTSTPWTQYELLVYAATGSAGLVLSWALLRGRLVPRALALLGVVGYAVLLLGGLLDAVGVLALGSTAGSVFYLPGGVFEVALPIWLLVKGFSPPGAPAGSSVHRDVVRSY